MFIDGNRHERIARTRQGPQRPPRILLTGGAGYIGSHVFVKLREAGFEPVILDNFANSHPGVVERLARIAGAPVLLERGNILDRRFVEDVLRRHSPAGVVHLAGEKAVGESVAQPLKYFRSNIAGAISLLEAMEAVYLPVGPRGPPALVFSSTATVYGDPACVPIAEDAPRGHSNPYGHTKLVVEDMLAAVRIAQPDWRIGVLRYFNPMGAHPSGLIGEHPTGAPNNLMPYLTQVAIGRRPHLPIFGGDYPTPDGTGVRDYIHVQDLAEGHVAALRTLRATGDSFTLNLGTGRGHSVLQVVRAFEAATGRAVPYRIVERRPGDVAQCYADPTRARSLLRWEATRTLEQMCADAWRWQMRNPEGYAASTDEARPLMATPNQNGPMAVQAPIWAWLAD